MTLRRDAGFWALAAALVLAAIASAGLRVTRERALVDVLFVVDITQSMLTRDMEHAGAPPADAEPDSADGISRLAFVRRLVPKLVAALPCGSRAGLAVFTERRTLTFIEPVEVCEDFAPLTSAIAALDWRMAWEGDSFVAKAVHHGLGRAHEMGVGLVFLTDGQEAPPLPYTGMPAYDGPADHRGGLIIGIGGATPAPIPKHDDLGNEIGFYGRNDVQHAPRRIGPPPEDASSRPGWHPRNNPYGEADLEGSEHLSEVRTGHLTALAAATGLAYAGGDQPPAVLAARIAEAVEPRATAASVAVRTVPAGLALALLVLAYLLPVLAARRSGRLGASKFTKGANP